MARKGRVSFIWRGKEVRQKVERAVGRASIGWAENVIAGSKRAVHRMSGTLSRSLHAAGRGYNGASDERVAKVGQIGSGGVGITLKVMALTGTTAYVEAGSWISYAIYEFARGGSHDFLSAAAKVAGMKYPMLLRKAVAEEQMS